MPPTFAELIDCPKPSRFRGGGQGFLFSRLGEKAPGRVYCWLFSQQEHRIAPRLLTALSFNPQTTSAGSLFPAVAWTRPHQGVTLLF